MNASEAAPVLAKEWESSRGYIQRFALRWSEQSMFPSQPRERPPRKPEIMSPAGYWPQLRAAIEAGADSVYFGLKHFSARAKVGFELSELPEVMRTLHQRGVRGLITFNTLVFEHELAEAATTIEAIANAGADALIVQDLGITKLAREIAPDLELHASTQMSITSAQGVQFAQSFGVDRVTLARELSLADIRAILAETDCALEMFVHGALCVAYSGQCFSSEAWGGRSANRGQCAQACRLPYELLVDGAVKPLADARYLLSPGDLCTLEHVPEIVAMGMAALKIEGRYKDADYVALTTGAYRKAVDTAYAGQTASPSAEERLQLEQVYSRGLGAHFVTGTNHQAVVSGRAPRHRGVWMGRVRRVDADRVCIDPSEAHRISPLKAGDGVVFDAADWRSPEEPEEGGRLYRVDAVRDGLLQLEFGNGAVRFPRIRPGDLVWRSDDPELSRVTRPFTEATTPVAKQAVQVRVVAHTGQPMEMIWSLVKRPQVNVRVRSLQPLAPAKSQSVSLAALREQIGRLGNTPYELDRLELDAEGLPFIPSSVLNQMRRDAVEQIAEIQGSVSIGRVQKASAGAPEQTESKSPGMPAIHLLVRTPNQLDAALALRPDSITLDYLDLYGLRPSIQKVKDSGIVARVASPRVLKPAETKIVSFLLSLDCEILLRASGMLQMLRQRPHPALIGDFSLNAANSFTARHYLNLGLARIAPTYDLNGAQIAALASEVGGDRIEAVAYQHLPVFHTEHCVFCRFLSKGTSYLDCGRPCESHQIALRDTGGRAHPVMADVGCRNTVFGAEAQEASYCLQGWLDAGIRHFRLEFVDETAAQVDEITTVLRSALTGESSYRRLESEWKRIAPHGVTQGSLFVPADHSDFPILQQPWH